MVNQMNDGDKEKWKGIVKKAWTDPSFKQELISSPSDVMKSNGMSVPEGISVTVVENTSTNVTLVIPPAPGENLSIEQVDNASLSDYDPGF